MTEVAGVFTFSVDHASMPVGSHVLTIALKSDYDPAITQTMTIDIVIDEDCTLDLSASAHEDLSMIVGQPLALSYIQTQLALLIGGNTTTSCEELRVHFVEATFYQGTNLARTPATAPIGSS